MLNIKEKFLQADDLSALFVPLKEGNIMDTNRQEYLIQKYLAKQCNQAELEEFFLLLQTSPGKKIMQQKLDEAMASMDENPISLSPDLSAEMQHRMLQTIRQQQAGRRRRTWLRSAAAVLIILSTWALWYKLGANIRDIILAANQKEVKIESGKIAKILLLDGTVIQAKGGSRLSYAENFNSMNQRRVQLEGEAYFEVAKDATKPFIIHTSSATVEVLGTAFNVKESKTTSEVIVAVIEGKVLFKDKVQSRTVYLEEQQIGVLKSDTLITISANSHNYLNWVSGRLTFDKTSLAAVAQQLKYIYDVNIIIEDTELLRLSFTADMKARRIQTVLEQIAASLNITYYYDYRNNAYVLKQANNKK